MRTHSWLLLIAGVALPACHSNAAPPRVGPGPAALAVVPAPAAPVAAGPCRAAAPLAPVAREATERPPPPPPTDPALVRACDGIVRATQLRVTPLLQPSADYPGAAELLGPLRRCYAAGAGAWAFVVEQATRGRADEVTGRPVSLDVRAVYLAPDGRAHPTAEVRHLAIATQSLFHHVTLDGVGVFDWDRDGRAELYFHESHSQHESGPEVARLERWWTFTARDDSPREYAPPAARATRIEDVDGDGRPDLVMRSPWVTAGECGLAGVDTPGPGLLLHSLPDGTFSSDDAAARGFIAHQCRERPERLITVAPDGSEPTGESAPGYRVGCARWWGRTADDVAAEIARTYPEAPDGGDDPLPCFSKAELLRQARVDPPEAFRLRCGQ